MPQGEREVRRQRLRPSQRGALCQVLHDLAEVSVGIGASLSHNGVPNQVRTWSRYPTSPRIVVSVNPTEVRASTNPASTSVSELGEFLWARRRALLA